MSFRKQQQTPYHITRFGQKQPLPSRTRFNLQETKQACMRIYMDWLDATRMKEQLDNPGLFITASARTVGSRTYLMPTIIEDWINFSQEKYDRIVSQYERTCARYPSIMIQIRLSLDTPVGYDDW